MPLIVPPVTRAAGSFSAGTGSPVTIDSSTALRPSTTTPSAGIFSPGRTRSRSPTCTDGERHVLLEAVARTTRAVFGAMPEQLTDAALVRLRARSSSTCPSSTSTVMTTAVSK